MSGSSPVRRFAQDGEGGDRPTFLDSHRAQSACARELARFTGDIEDRISALRPDGIEHTPAFRVSPSRCIVQLGPVALTAAWLRTTRDSVADGQLLVIVWRGAVAPPRVHSPERHPSRRASAPAVAVWEEVLIAEGATEASWRWRSGAPAAETYSSSELAQRCVEELYRAYGEPVA